MHLSRVFFSKHLFYDIEKEKTSLLTPIAPKGGQALNKHLFKLGMLAWHPLRGWKWNTLRNICTNMETALVFSGNNPIDEKTWARITGKIPWYWLALSACVHCLNKQLLQNGISVKPRTGTQDMWVRENVVYSKHLSKRYFTLQGSFVKDWRS